MQQERKRKEAETLADELFNAEKVSSLLEFIFIRTFLVSSRTGSTSVIDKAF